ncbi:MAG: hypothetical protein O3C60_20300, partial [Planctomycetota bacterium]|nr:hypothetical protein [Planctomycetota bacterium]
NCDDKTDWPSVRAAAVSVSVARELSVSADKVVRSTCPLDASTPTGGSTTIDSVVADDSCELAVVIIPQSFENTAER